MMSFELKFAVSLILVSTLYSGDTLAQQAHTSSIKRKGYRTATSGTMNMNLPTTSNDAVIDKIYYPPLNQYSFQTTRYCGDGDVARYYAQNPQEDNAVDVKEVPIVLGYWIEDGNSRVPTKDNWFSVGYTIFQTKGSPITNLYKANSKSEISALGALSAEYKSLMLLTKFAPENKSFRFYAAAMACKSFQDNPDFSKESPTAVQIANQIINLPKELEYQLSNNAREGDKLKISISPQKDKFTFKLGEGTPVDNVFEKMAKDLSRIQYKGGSKKDNLEQMRQALKSPLRAMEYQMDTCRNAISTAERKYWFEPFALNISCNTLRNSEAMALLRSLDDDDTLNSESSFTEKRNALVLQFKIAAIQESIQEQIQSSTDFNQNKTRCFAPGQRYLNKILASMVIPFVALSPTKYKIENMPKLSLPEGNYALGAATKYYVDESAVFMNFINEPSKRPSIEFSKSIAPEVDFNATLNFNFNLRDVGCDDGVFYCSR